MAMMALDDHPHARSFRPCLFCQLAHRVFPTENFVMDAGLGFDDETFEVTKVIEDESVDLAAEFVAVVLGMMMRARFRRRLGQAGHPTRRRRQNLSGIAAKALHPASNIVDVPL
jgi:hypothetical protein